MNEVISEDKASGGLQGCAKEFVSKADRIPQQVCRGILEYKREKKV